MANRPAKPDNMPWLTPHLTVRTLEAAIDFYQRAFGFECRFSLPGPDGKLGHAELTFRDAVIMLGPECGYGGTTKAPVSGGFESPVGLFIYCDDVDAMCRRASAAGAKVLQPPTDMFWGDRMCKLTDPDGHVWSFATNVGDFDPTKMPR